MLASAVRAAPGGNVVSTESLNHFKPHGNRPILGYDFQNRVTQSAFISGEEQTLFRAAAEFIQEQPVTDARAFVPTFAQLRALPSRQYILSDQKRTEGSDRVRQPGGGKIILAIALNEFTHRPLGRQTTSAEKFDEAFEFVGPWIIHCVTLHFEQCPLRSLLCSPYSRIDFAMLRQPRQVALLSVFLYLAQQLHGFSLVARFARVVRRNDHFHFNGYDVLIRLDQPRSFDSFASNTHCSIHIKEVNGYQFRKVAPLHVCPYSLELGPVRQYFANFHRWIGLRILILTQACAVFEPYDGLPFHYTAKFQPFGSMLTDNIAFLANKASQMLEKAGHRRFPFNQLFGPVTPSPAPPSGFQSVPGTPP
ncbi:MAG: hypothetical protein SGJ19_14810 [Planctomycetia bacterium]|nr:hypothetical protein [Planctomycetia bacterium]